MPPFSYPYQLAPYTYRAVPYPLPIRHRYDGGWGNGAAAAGYSHYPSDYYSHAPPPAVGPVRSHSRPRPSGRPVLSEEQKLQNTRDKLIKHKPADRHIHPAPPLEATPAPVAKAPIPDPAPEVPPPVEKPTPLPPKEETATEITPLKELHYPSRLHRERVAKLHARNDKLRRSTYTVFVIIHEVDSVNIGVQVSNSLQDSNNEVLRIMARYHPRAFKLASRNRKVGNPTATTDNGAASDEEGDGGVIKTEAGNGVIHNNPEEQVVVVGDDDEDSSTAKGQEKEDQRKRRFVYSGEWKFTHASTLKLEAKIEHQVIKILSALKTVRHERKEPKQGKK